MKKAKTLLLVDDRKEVVDVVRAVAEEKNVRLLAAEDGQEGLDLANAEIPDIIIIRRSAPVLDALSMSVLLKQRAETKTIPVLVICPEVSGQERERYRDAGCCDCLREPITKTELENRLKDWLP